MSGILYAVNIPNDTTASSVVICTICGECYDINSTHKCPEITEEFYAESRKSIHFMISILQKIDKDQLNRIEKKVDFILDMHGWAELEKSFKLKNKRRKQKCVEK